MFAFAYGAGYCNYRGLVQVFYPALDLSCLPLSRMDMTSFFVETCVNKQNPCNFSKEFVIPHRASHGVLSLKVESSEG